VEADSKEKEEESLKEQRKQFERLVPRGDQAKYLEMARGELPQGSELKIYIRATRLHDRDVIRKGWPLALLQVVGAFLLFVLGMGLLLLVATLIALGLNYVLPAFTPRFVLGVIGVLALIFPGRSNSDAQFVRGAVMIGCILWMLILWGMRTWFPESLPLILLL